MVKVSRVCAGICIAISFIACGCSRAPRGIEPPKIDPVAAGEAALTTYDKNGDGVLSAAELEPCPSLASAIERIDANGDGQLSATEIVDRIRKWQDSGIGLTSFSCQVLLAGKPLEDAMLTLVPEDFLGDQVLPATGVTDKNGYATLAVDTEKLPPEHRNIWGVQTGFYRLQITHASQSLAAKYNTQTELGCEVSMAEEDEDGHLAVDLQPR